MKQFIIDFGPYFIAYMAGVISVMALVVIVQAKELNKREKRVSDSV